MREVRQGVTRLWTGSTSRSKTAPVEYLPRVGVGDLFDGGEEPVAGVVDDDIETSETALDGSDRMLHLLLVGEVDAERE